MGWRERAAPVITEVLNRTRGADEQTIKRELREAYPFGARRHHPYKIWLDEVQRQRGLKKAKPKEAVDPRQSEMFVDDAIPTRLRR